jgi:GT2 family glycosyltransferase
MSKLINAKGMNTKCGVVILNYNSHDLTVRLVNQISSYSSISKICVVDNNSNDNFENDFNNPKIHYIKNCKNLGYNSGNNVGLRYLVNECNCDYVFIANPDVDFENSAISEITETMSENPELVVLSTKRFGIKGESIHQYFDFPSFLSSIKKCFYVTRLNYSKDINLKQNEEIDSSNGVYFVDAVPGAFFGIKSSFLKKIKFLYEGIFLYGEEIFLGRQVHEYGYKAGIINTSCYYHNHAQNRLSNSNRKMFLRDRKSLIKYYSHFRLLKWYSILLLEISVYLGTIEYNLMFYFQRVFKKHTLNKSSSLIFCSNAGASYKKRKSFDTTINIITPRNAEEYIKYIADGNYNRFFEIGHAIEGHNGPHGHLDTPVRNTAHYLIIYAYLFDTTNETRYKDICIKFFDYLIEVQNKSISGAIQCMSTDKFDHLNGLIGQAWVIESLVYYYEKFKDKRSLEVAKNIFYSQNYDYELHLWRRIELDGKDIGIDNAYNHQVMFAACSSKLSNYCSDPKIHNIIYDFINHTERDFNIYNSGLLKHSININSPEVKSIKRKKIIKLCLTPLKLFDAKLFDPKYIERAYHIFDIYCFSILREQFEDSSIFSSNKYKKAVKYALDIDKYNKENGVYKHLKKNKSFNIYSYSYNSPVFEFPYVQHINGEYDEDMNDRLYNIQKQLMLDDNIKLFSKNNPDIETWNAKTYELIRFLEKNKFKKRF